MGLLDALRDPQFRRDVGTNANQLAQSMSNTAASTVTAPVDAIAWLLRKGRIPVPQNPIGGSEWAAQQGLMADVPDGLPKAAGETLGLLAPMAGTKEASAKIAQGLRQMGANAALPNTLNKQAGMALFNLDGLPNQGKELIQTKADDLASKLKQMGMQAEVTHSGSRAGPSSYVKVFDPETGRFFTQDVRLSGHSKGAFNNQMVWDVNESEFPKVLELAQKMRDMGASPGYSLPKEFASEYAPDVYAKSRPMISKALQEAKNSNEFSKAFSNSGKYVGKQAGAALLSGKSGINKATSLSEFVEIAKQGKKIRTNNSSYPLEEVAKNPYDLGLINNYPEKDIAAFYLSREPYEGGAKEAFNNFLRDKMSTKVKPQAGEFDASRYFGDF
jgi:hypothetical protein